MSKLTCPYCGGKFTLREASGETVHHELEELAAKLGGTWRLVDEYVECFRQSEHGWIIDKKRLRLLEGIARLLESRQFEYKGKRYRTTREQIITAMIEICNLGKLRFKNNNYLKAMLVEGAERVSAEGMTAKEEAERERHRAEGVREEAAELPIDGKARGKLRGILGTLNKGLKP